MKYIVLKNSEGIILDCQEVYEGESYLETISKSGWELIEGDKILIQGDTYESAN